MTKKNLAAILAAVMLFAVVLAPASLADNDAAVDSVAAAVEKTHATVSAAIGEINAAVAEKVGVDVQTLENIWNYGDYVEANVEAATDEFVAMLEGIGDAYDKGDKDGIMNTAKTFTDGLKTYLGSLKDGITP